MLRGALQGVGDLAAVAFSLVGEQAVRLPVGGGLALAGLGVFGAYVGTPLAFVAMGTFCLRRLRRHAQAHSGPATATAGDPAVRRLWIHVRRAWAPIAGLIVIAVLQNIDIIAAKHRFSSSVASSYGAVAVAAKVLIWVAMGAGFYLVPEVTRRRAASADTRPVLFRALAIVGVCAIPVLLIYAVAAHPLIRIGFGADHTRAAGSLLVLGLAFAALSATYLAIQYLLALHRVWFLVPLVVVAVAEPVLLLHASRRPTGFAAVALAVQLAGLVLAFAFALRRETAPPSGSDPATGEEGLEPIPEPIS